MFDCVCDIKALINCCNVVEESCVLPFIIIIWRSEAAEATTMAVVNAFVVDKITISQSSALGNVIAT